MFSKFPQFRFQFFCSDISRHNKNLRQIQLSMKRFLDERLSFLAGANQKNSRIVRVLGSGEASALTSTRPAAREPVARHTAFAAKSPAARSSCMSLF